MELKELIKASLIRTAWTACEIIVAMLGTHTFITEVNWSAVLSATLLACIVTFLKCIATGLPEVKYEQHLYMQADEPVDSELEESEVDDEDE